MLYMFYRRIRDWISRLLTELKKICDALREKDPERSSGNWGTGYPKLMTKLARERLAQVFRVTTRLVWGNGSPKLAELFDQTEVIQLSVYYVEANVRVFVRFRQEK